MKRKEFLAGKNRYFFISIGLLLLALLLQYALLKKVNRPEYFTQRIQEHALNEINKAKIDQKVYLEHLLSDNKVEYLEHAGLQTRYPYYTFVNGRLLHWSDYRFVPRYRDLAGTDEIRFFQAGKDKYILSRTDTTLERRNLEIFTLIPLTHEPNIVNQYLKVEVNHRIFDDQEFEVFAESSDFLHDIFTESGKWLFSLRYNAAYRVADFRETYVIAGIILLSLLSFVIFLLRLTWSYIDQHKFMPGFLILVGSLFLVRFLMLAADFPYAIVPIDLFDLKNYASSSLNPSLGDLLLNMIVITALSGYIFRHYFKTILFKKLLLSSHLTRSLISVCLIAGSYMLLTFQYYLVYSLSVHSQWSLDITAELSFSQFKFFSYLVFLLGGVIYFLLSHVVFKIFFRINDLGQMHILYLFLAGTILYAIIGWLAGWEVPMVIFVNILFYTVLYAFQLPNFIGRIQYVTFVYFFVCGLPTSIIGAYAIYNDRVRQQGIEEERLASQLLTENDPFTEFLLMDAIGKIKGDAFIQNRLFSPYTSKDIVRQKIRRVFLNTYLDRYDIQIHLFNSLGEPFDAAPGLLNYRQMKERYQNYQTNNENIYFISRYDEGVLNRYLTFVEIRRYNQIAGYALLDLRLKRIIPNSVYPLLLTDNRFVQVVQQNKLSYGIFDDDKLIFNYGDFNYQKNIDAALLADPTLQMKEGLIIDGLRHRVFSGNDDKSVVISSKPYPLLRTATNFSFLFLLFVISILIVLLIISIYVRINNLKQNYASRIQMFLNVAYFVPLLIVCITIVSVILQSYRKETELQYLERARNLSTRISSMVKSYQEKRIDAEQLRVQISEVAGFAELDINIFNTGGRLLVASQPLIYENELLSEHINPLALVHIAIQHDNYVVLEENVGELTFKNTYFGIKSSETGELIGILSLPFFDFRLEYEQNVIVVLMNVMNIFTFIFLIFLFGSYFASRWLTFPLRLITQKIRRTTLAYNEPLAWNSDDEIGLMVGEYNKMLENLEESRKALARSEKESAWREMARQVAHEIKNPLTPMQLTLQHMRRTIAGENDAKTEHRLRQIDSLLHQISTLSDIATSFSEFAKMPVPGTEEFEFSALLRETIELYDNKESGKIHSKIEPGFYLVLGDRQWIGRAISNIIINGLQSVAEGEKPVLRSRLVMLKNKRLLLSIMDNGVGISEEIRDKIFIPNFSTKPNGSGIGLAIARRGIEHAGGKIWFESEQGSGTTFFIELPLAT